MVPRPFIAVYMMTNRRHGTLYVGVTANLVGRVGQHREGSIAGFTQTHHLTRLVWFEQRESIVGAIKREKSLKKYKREWKINLIERRKSRLVGPICPALLTAGAWVTGTRARR